jgi:hypothetical protein
MDLTKYAKYVIFCLLLIYLFMESRYLQLGAGLLITGAVLGGCQDKAEDQKLPISQKTDHQTITLMKEPEMVVEGGPIVTLDIKDLSPGIQVTQNDGRLAIETFKQLNSSGQLASMLGPDIIGPTDCGIHDMVFIEGKKTTPLAFADCPSSTDTFSVITMSQREYDQGKNPEDAGRLYQVQQKNDGTVTIMSVRE